MTQLFYLLAKIRMSGNYLFKMECLITLNMWVSYCWRFCKALQISFTCSSNQLFACVWRRCCLVLTLWLAQWYSTRGYGRTAMGSPKRNRRLRLQIIIWDNIHMFLRKIIWKITFYCVNVIFILIRDENVMNWGLFVDVKMSDFKVLSLYLGWGQDKLLWKKNGP